MILRQLICLFCIIALFSSTAFSADCRGHLEPKAIKSQSGSGSDGEEPPSGYIKFVTGALSGQCLRTNKHALGVYVSRLVAAWSFIIGGFYLARYTRGEERNAEQPMDFPVSVLLNTALVMWGQNEVACQDEYWNLGKNQSNQGRSYLRDSWERYKSLAQLSPLSILSFVSLSATESGVRWRLDPEHRKHPFSRDLIQRYLSDAFFIMAFEPIYLFPRFAAVQNPFEFSLLPKVTNYLTQGKTLGFYMQGASKGLKEYIGRFAEGVARSRSPQALVQFLRQEIYAYSSYVYGGIPIKETAIEAARVARALGVFSGEWLLYRIPVATFDSWILFLMREDGLKIGETTLYNPSAMSKKVIDSLWESKLHQKEESNGRIPEGLENLKLENSNSSTQQD